MAVMHHVLFVQFPQFQIDLLVGGIPHQADAVGELPREVVAAGFFVL